MDYTTLLGLLAGALTTLGFVPQVVKTWRSRATRGISLQWLVLLCLGLALWLLYGVLAGSTPILVSNTVALVLAASMLALKLKHG